MIHGIPVKLLNPDAQGGLEQAYFATVRRHPPLKEAIKGLLQAKGALTLAAKASELQGAAFEQAQTLAAAQQAQEAATASETAMFEATCAVGDAVRAVIVEGFRGAGYPSNEVDRLADLVPPERFGELQRLATLGGGILDFTANSARP